MDASQHGDEHENERCEAKLMQGMRRPTKRDERLLAESMATDAVLYLSKPTCCAKIGRGSKVSEAHVGVLHFLLCRCVRH